MNIKVLLFAELREIAGQDEIILALEAQPKAEEVIAKLVELYPAIKPQREVLQLSMDGEYISGGDQVLANSEIAVLTPLSGG